MIILSIEIQLQSDSADHVSIQAIWPAGRGNLKLSRPLYSRTTLSITLIMYRSAGSVTVE